MKYSPVGICIYCGKIGTTQNELSDEHIIPEGLGGELILPEASCSTCAEITSKVELYSLREYLGDFRAHFLKLKRRKKTRPKTRSIFVEKNGIRQKVKVSIAEHPYLLAMHDLPPPAILVYPKNGERYDACKLIYRTPNDKTVERTAKLGGSVGNTRKVDMPLFSRMLAKIAHSYAVARYGLNAFQPFLPPLILGDVDNARLLVGGYAHIDEPFHIYDGDKAHYLEPGFLTGWRAKSLLIVHVQLFVPFEMPVYQVVTGI